MGYCCIRDASGSAHIQSLSSCLRKKASSDHSGGASRASLSTSTGANHTPRLRAISLVGAMKRSALRGSLRKASGASSRPMHTTVEPEPLMKTASYGLPSASAMALRSSLICAMRGTTSSAGGSRSLMHSSSLGPSSASRAISSRGSAPGGASPGSSPSPLKMAGVGQLSEGLTSSMGVARLSGGRTSSTRSPRPVTYAAPSLKKKGQSLPISADHSSRSCSLARRPQISFAAHSAVAPLALPPPSPAPVGTTFVRLAAKCCEAPVFSR
mmetsp:Transcript_22250/g.68795  ORF Transcript_22250/g.68795 Transcript_22250/m.68795 type:complete len:269 (+) Transcript_22250:1359-2165(+)